MAIRKEKWEKNKEVQLEKEKKCHMFQEEWYEKQ